MIRQFQTTDAISCSALILGCLEQDPSYSPALLRKIGIGETPQAMIERARLFYVAAYEKDGEILGVAGLDLNEIRFLYVSPLHQRRGIGRDLIEHLVGMVPRVLFADVFAYSTRQAIPFYRACGFADKGPFSFNIDGETLETEFMALPLP